MNSAEEILEFWFEGVGDTTVADKKKMPFRKWFNGGISFSEEVRLRFENTLKEAAAGRCAVWENTARGKLALILLYDQCARHIYRETPQMYAYDTLAQALARSMVQGNEDRQLSLIERLFACMPLMHAEDLVLQGLSVQSFERLVKEAGEKYPYNAPYFEYHLGYARKYHGIIERFGRFPHRNALLERKPAPEELVFLKECR